MGCTRSRGSGLFSVALVFACGPTVADTTGSGSGSSASGSDTSTSSGTATAPATSDESSAGLSTTSVGPASTGSTSTGVAPTGGGCEDIPPAIAPSVPRGCTSIPLVDPEGTPLPESPSGLVRCPEAGAPGDNVYSIFRTGRVTCPFSTGECACDSDCGRGQQCLCDYASGDSWPNQDGNACVPSDCSTDADCDGERCRAEVLFCGSYGTPVAFRCTSPEDDCEAHTTCIDKAGQGNQYCSYDSGMEMFTCEPGAVCE